MRDQGGASTSDGQANSEPPKWAQFEVLVANLVDGVTVQDTNGRLVYANPAGARMSGYASPAELLAAPVGDYLKRFEVRDLVGELLPLTELPGRRALVLGQADAVLRVRDLATGAERWSDVRSFVVRDSAGFPEFVVNVIRDVSETTRQQHLLEEQAQELEEQTAQAQALTEELEQANDELSRALHAEQEELRREAYMSKATELLGASLDYEATLDRVAALIVPELADWCSVELVGEDFGSLRQLAVAHVDPDKVRWAKQLRETFPPNMDAPNGLPNVLKTGEPELYESLSDELLAASVRTPEELRIVRELGLRSAMIVPLRAHERIVGAVTFVMAESNKAYGQAELAFASELARRAGMAIERSALHQHVLNARNDAEKAHAEAEEHARWLSRLQLLTVGLSRATTSADAIDLATNLARVSFEADRATVWRLSADRKSLELVGHHGLPDAVAARVQSMSVEASTPLADAVRTGEPVLTADQAAIVARYPDAAEATVATGTNGGVAMPVKVGGDIIGGLTFAYDKSRQFSNDFVTAIRTFSKELGQALERTRVIADLDTARKAADEASRAKSAFLATMSHELRTPINAIIGFTDLLELGVADGDRESESLYLGRIRKNTEHLLDLINDVLDWSKVEAGELAVHASREVATDAIAEALNVVSGQATARGVMLESSANESATYVGDPLRVRQILLNLLSNGIKFTAPGGRVATRCHTDGAVTRFTVEDTGIGIEDAERELIFEPFMQVERGYTREHGGTGLGLSISRRLARLMDGDVTLERSALGEGSRFVLTLPSGIRD